MKLAFSQTTEVKEQRNKKSLDEIALENSKEELKEKRLNKYGYYLSSVVYSSAFAYSDQIMSYLSPDSLNQGKNSLYLAMSAGILAASSIGLGQQRRDEIRDLEKEIKGREIKISKLKNYY